MRARPIQVLLLGLISGSAMAQDEPGTIVTIAGGYTGDGLRADHPSVGIQIPGGMAFDDEGNLYIVGDDNRLRRINGSDNIIGTVAGDGIQGNSGDGGLARDARLRRPRDVDVDSEGNLLVLDGNPPLRIRRIDAATQIITTLSELDNNGLSLAVDPDDNVVVAERDGNRLVRVDALTGEQTVIAGDGTPESSGDGGPATQARVVRPADVAVDDDGNVFFSENPTDRDARVRRIDATTGIVTTIAGGGDLDNFSDPIPALGANLGAIDALALNSLDRLFIAARGRIFEYSAAGGTLTSVAGGGSSFAGDFGDGGPATDAAFTLVSDIAFDAQDNLFVLESFANRLRSIDAATGIISRESGGLTVEGAVTDVSFLSRPAGLAADREGNLFVSEVLQPRISRIGRNLGFIEAIAGTGILGQGIPAADGAVALDVSLDQRAIAVGPDQNPYFHNVQGLFRINLETGLLEKLADGAFQGTSLGIAVDDDGSVYLSELFGQRIYRFDPLSGEITPFAGTGDRGYAGDGGQASEALFAEPAGLLLLDGQLVIPDRGNHVIRSIDLGTGLVTTLAGDGQPGRDDALNPLEGRLFEPGAVAADSEGNLFILEIVGVRRIDGLTGALTTVAGGGGIGGDGDGGNALDATFDTVDSQIAVDHLGHVFLTDFGNDRVRRIETDRPITIETEGGAAVAGAGTAVGVDDASLLVGTPGVSVEVYDAFKSAEPEPAQTLMPPLGMAPDFGAVIATSPDFLVVGAPGNIPGGKGDESSLQAAIYERLQGQWTLKQTIKGQDGGDDDGFGSSIAIDGDRMVIGAPRDAEGEAEGSGAVYLFELQAGEFVPLDKVKPAVAQPGQDFGASVALRDGNLAVGSPRGIKEGTQLTTGVVDLYEALGNNLNLTGTVSGSASGEGDQFGASLALEGDVMVVGAPADAGAGQATGGAYVFDFGAQTEAALLAPSAGSSGAAFGASVGVSQGQVVIGSPFEPIGSGTTGAVYRFDGLQEAERITSPPGQQAFGASIAVFNDRIAIGAPESGLSKGIANSGAAGIRRYSLRYFSNGFERN